MLQITQQFIWNARVINNIENQLKIGVKKAAFIYFSALIKELSKHWGSISYGGIYRFRKTSSYPGQAPFMQTQNLLNSIKLDFQFSKDKFEAEISTDVPYAATLEFGGSSPTLSAASKPYTQYILINPLSSKQAPDIEPRPAWMPVFIKKLVQMINAIKYAH